MSNKKPTNIAASVNARLKRLAREHDEDVQLVLTRYANERLLYRLAQSPHAKSFVLKGAALFIVWTGRPHRATRDVDLLGLGDASEPRLLEVFRDVFTLDVPDDGVTFDLGSMTATTIREEQSYGGTRSSQLHTCARILPRPSSRRSSRPWCSSASTTAE